MGDTSEVQKSPERLDTLQERNPKGTEAGRPHMPRDKPAWQKTGLAEQSAVSRAQEEKGL